MGWHRDFLQYYIKKEDAPIEFINRGIEILEQYRKILRSAGKGFWDFRPGSPFWMYAEDLNQRSRAIDVCRNTQHHQGCLSRFWDFLCKF